MKQKLFENVSGNQFKLITESVTERTPQEKLIREGLKKVFGAGHKELSYRRLHGVGMGYLKSVEEAKKTAIQEARTLAKEYGYVDNENAHAFVKEAMTGETFQETSHDEIGGGASQTFTKEESQLNRNKPDSVPSETPRFVEISYEILEAARWMIEAKNGYNWDRIVPLALKIEKLTREWVKLSYKLSYK